MKKIDYCSFAFREDKIIYLNQTKLPLQEEYIETSDYQRIAASIENLELRGAPLIGIAAAYALALALKNTQVGNAEVFHKAYERLAKTRPTAVNLFFTLSEMKEVFEKNKHLPDLYDHLITKAKMLHQQDVEHCRRIGENGLPLFIKRSKVLTHCNTGRLATGGEGTAFNIIRTGFNHGFVDFVYVDETRPLLQGLRLTAYELEKQGIPFSINTDSAAASLLAKGEIDLVVVGADRIALNGDTANKVGTLNLAVLCNYHSIPFYIAAPSTTIDRKILTGADINIEYRSNEEILNFNGIPAAPPRYETFSPAFDVTPSHLITAIITEKQVYRFPYNFLYE